MLKHILLIWIVLIGLSVQHSQASELKNIIGTPIQKCLTCICFARTGRADKRHCSMYPFSRRYWKRAGSPSVSYSRTESSAIRKCKRDENCALNAIKNYTESYSYIDCNNDGVFDCKDRFAIHLFRDNCQERFLGSTFGWRFNECMAYDSGSFNNYSALDA